MERSLCLIIGKEPLPNETNYIKLTKPVNDPRKLDAFIMKRFANSEEVREFFKEEIEKYLITNEKIITEIKNRTGRMYRGSIAIIENNHGELRKLRVLYSDTPDKLKELLDDIVFMKRIAENDELSKAKYLKLFSPYEIDSILSRNGQDYPLKELKIILKVWKEHLKNDFYGTDKLRIILKNYEEYKKELEKEQKIKKKTN